MGYEAKCRARVEERGGQVREGDATVLLETDELIIRGEARVRIPRTAITNVVRRAGVVTITAPTSTISLALGAPAAAKWEARLKEPPKRLIDKLDVKPGAKVWLCGIDEQTLIIQLEKRAASVSRGASASKCDVVFAQVNDASELGRIDKASKAITPDGAIWVVHPKGKRGVADTVIFARANALGLAYTKVARVSDEFSAEKLVWPVAQRASRK